MGDISTFWGLMLTGPPCHGDASIPSLLRKLLSMYLAHLMSPNLTLSLLQAVYQEEVAWGQCQII